MIALKAKVQDFALPSTVGETLTLSQVCAHSKAVVLTTFPLAFTGGWQTQLSAFKAQVPQFEALGVKVIGLSIDHKFAQKAFAEKLDLNFPLVADPNRDVSRTLGTLLPEVAGVKEVNMRAVLIVSPAMEVQWTFGIDVSTQPNVGEVLEQAKKIVTVA